MSVEVDAKDRGPIRKTILKTFYVANHSASESIAIALGSIADVVDNRDPWNGNKHTMRVLSKELRACVPEEHIPMHVPITVADIDEDLTRRIDTVMMSIGGVKPLV